MEAIKVLRTLTFENREIPTYLQQVDSDKLVIGETYFHVSYVDHDMTIPIVSTLTYIGKNLLDDDVSTLYFQDVESYRAGVRISDENTDPDTGWFETWPEASHSLCEFEKALELLMLCSLRRKGIPGA